MGSSKKVILQLDKEMKWVGTCGDGATGGIEVHVDGFGRIFGFEEEELRNDDVGSVVGDGSVDADNALLQKAREDVVCPLTSGRVLYHHWDQTVGANALSLNLSSMEQQIPRKRFHDPSHGSQVATQRRIGDFRFLLFWFD